MGVRMYSLEFSDVATTLDVDLFQVEPSITPCQIYAVYVSQTLDVGDAAAENISIKLKTVTDEVTDDAVPERPLDAGDAAFTGDTAINETTQLATGEIIYHSEVWNIALPFVWLPPPEMRIWVPVGLAFIVDMNTPTDSLTMSGTIYFGQGGS